MSKKLLLLFLLIFCCVFVTACNNNSTSTPPSAENAVKPDISTQEKKEIEDAWITKTGYSFFWYSDEHLDGMRYYGNYNGHIILFKPSAIVAVTFVDIGHQLFVSNSNFNIYAYEHGAFNNLSELLQSGTISELEIEKIIMTHNSYEKEIQSKEQYTEIDYSKSIVVPSLSNKTKKEIEDACSEQGIISVTWGSNASSARYYGNFNGYEILFVPTPMCSVTTIKIAGYHFVYGNVFYLYAYKNGIFHKLENAYESNMISKEDVLKIAELHYFINN